MKSFVLNAALATLLLAATTGCGSSAATARQSRPAAAKRAAELRAENWGEDAIRARLRVEGYKAPSYEITDIDGSDCKSNETKYGLCPYNEFFGKTPAQANAARVARAKAAERRFQRLNAWHRGFYQQDANVYWRWRDLGYCNVDPSQFCWTVQVITANGCPSYVEVHGNEYEGNTIVNDLFDNQVYGIPPRTPRIFYLGPPDYGDNLTLDDITVDCK